MRRLELDSTLLRSACFACLISFLLESSEGNPNECLDDQPSASCLLTAILPVCVRLGRFRDAFGFSLAQVPLRAQWLPVLKRHGPTVCCTDTGDRQRQSP
jgi:hypothetical protein